MALFFIAEWKSNIKRDEMKKKTMKIYSCALLSLVAGIIMIELTNLNHLSFFKSSLLSLIVQQCIYYGLLLRY